MPDQAAELVRMAEGATRFIRDRSPNSIGLFRTERFDVDKASWSSEACDCDDFGDIAPFMTWLDKVKGSKLNSAWAGNQFRLMEAELKQASGFYSPYVGGIVGKSLLSVSYPLNNIDLLLGLDIMQELTGEDMYRKGFLELCDSFVRYAMNAKGFLRSALVPALGMQFPQLGYMGFKPVASGLVIECLSDAFEMTGRESYVEAALKMSTAFTGNGVFRKHGIFPDNFYPLVYTPSRLSSVTKSNTSMTNALLRLFEVTENEDVRELASRALWGMMLYRSPEGAFYKSYDVSRGAVFNRTVEKGDSQAVTDVLINAYRILGDDEWLALAEACAGFWMGSQSENGLFAERKVGQKDWFRCTIDAHADMTVIMAKLHELTRKPAYLKSVKSAASAFGLFVAKNRALYDNVDCRDGKVLGTVNELKLMGGALKGMMAAHAGIKGIKIFGDKSTMLLTRDR